MTVNLDDVPSFGAETIADQTYTQDTAITTLTLPEATGGDGTLTYTLTPLLPGGLTFDATGRTITGTPTSSQAAAEYTYTATDENGDAVSLTFTIRVAAVLAIGGVTSADQAENAAYTGTATLSGKPVGDITWTLSGTDAGSENGFALSNQSNTSATVTLAGQDFESPADADGDNIYNYKLTARDDDGNTASVDVSITVTNVNESSTLSLTGLADGIVNENLAFTATASLAGALGDVTWTLGGADKDDFTLTDPSTTGVTVTLTNPNFESPTDFDQNNIYEYTLTATDNNGNTTTSPATR